MRHPTVAALLEAAALVLLGSAWLLWTDARTWPLLGVLAMMAVVVALQARSRHKHLSVEWESRVTPDDLR
jgi:hypothetical protein